MFEIMEWYRSLARGKQQVLLFVLGLFFIGACWYGFMRTPSAEKVTPIPVAKATPKTVVSPKEPEKVIVDVKGAVSRPGVYRVDAAARVQEAIDLSGGATKDADLNQVNLAAKVKDEMVILVPKKGEKGVQAPQTAGVTTESSGKININTATKEQLDTLPGIGPKRVEQIIAFREKNGPFKSVEGLKDVQGIGDKIFLQLKDLIVAQ